MAQPRDRYAWCLLSILFFCYLLALPTGWSATQADPAPKTAIELFVREGCPHCTDAQRFMAALAKERDDFSLTVQDIRHAPDALFRLQQLSQSAGIASPGVPTLRIGSTLIIGFDSPDTTGNDIRRALEHRTLPASSPRPPPDVLPLPFNGPSVTAESLGLPLFTIVIGLLDGLNPCAMWVLVLMLSVLASLRDRKRMLWVAGTFVAIQGLTYFAFMAAWLNLFLFIGLSRLSEVILGALALLAGAINLKDSFWPGTPVSLSIPSAARPGIYAHLRQILQARRLLPAILGAVMVGILVQIVELMCTSGFPALYTRILTGQQLEWSRYYGYLLLYNLMYMADDVIVLGIAIVTLSQRRLQEKEGRGLKLMAGLAMLGLGIYLIIRQ